MEGKRLVETGSAIADSGNAAKEAGAPADRRGEKDSGMTFPFGQQKTGGAGKQSEEADKQEAQARTEEEAVFEEAQRLAAQYNYDAAAAVLEENPMTAGTEEAEKTIAAYRAKKTELERKDISRVTHIFFHSLVVDPENAFDKTHWGRQADGYNQVMTTVDEFKKMLDVLYENDFVLVRLHDMAKIEKNADGEEEMTEGDIMLPADKKPLVISQDDVCYYEYMTGAGFADRMVLDENGRPTCLYTDRDGKTTAGAYDLVPILDQFVEEHPDFSYRGAKACLAFTGYNGILGYRTDETYDPSSPLCSAKEPNTAIEEDRASARAVIKALREDGYELASHSWGHRNLSKISMEQFRKDTDRWDKNVNQLLLDGMCDILIYPFGADVGDWHPYTRENERFDYLWKKGFRYFCNVDSTQYWVQTGSDWLRQGRRNLDGDAMWKDISGGKNRLSDLFPDVSAIFDERRPTPVPD